MRYLKFVPCILGAFAISMAVPRITGVSNSGNSFTITGSGFGTKATAAPVKFDDFENGTNGERLYDQDSSWQMYDQGQGALYSNTVSHSGSMCVGTHNTNGECFKTNYYTYSPASSEIFISYWWRTTSADLNDSTIIKMTRMNSSEAAGGGGIYNGAGNTTLGGTYDLARSSGPYCAYNNGVTDEVILKYFAEPPLNTWLKVEMYKKLSTPGANDGIMECNLLGTDYAIDTAAMTRASGYSFLMNTVLLGLMDGSDNNHDYYVYIDDIYIDNTRARVELGNMATWSACTKREIQIPTAWADGKVVCNINRGAFQNSDPLYLFVVDANGKMNAAGYEYAPGAAITRSVSNRQALSSTTIHLHGTGFFVALPGSAQSPELAVVDLSGRMVFHTMLNKATGAIYTCSWPGAPAVGMYFAIIKETSGGRGSAITRTKLIVDR